MIVTFRTNDLLETLKNIVGVAENKQNMPILANVYFKVGSDRECMMLAMFFFRSSFFFESYHRVTITYHYAG